MKKSTRTNLGKTISYVLLTALSIIVAFPIIWLLFTSLKTYPEIYDFPITYFPREITFEHFGEIAGTSFFKNFLNSIIVSSGTAIMSLILGIFPAYAFSKYSFKLKRPMLVIILLLQMSPMVAFLVPMFSLLRNVGILDTYFGLIVSYLPFTAPITVVFLRSFFAGIPKEIEEAAKVDGASLYQTFVKVIFPITLPGIAAVGIYAFLFTWKELMYAMTFMTTQGKQTIPAFLQLFVSQYSTRWGPLFAGSLMATIPPLIMFIVLQRYFIEGLTSGSVKG